MKRTVDLGKDNIFSLVLKLALPSMLAQFVNVLYNIVDRMFIGNIPNIGDIALAGVGVCSPIVTMLTSFGSLIGVGGSVYMATKMGRGDMQKAKEIMYNSFVCLLGLSFVLTIVFLFTKGYLLNWFGASSETFVYANQYVTIYTLGAVFAIFSLGMNYFITCQGFAGIAMFSVIIGALTNIVLDYVFVFKLGMEVPGAAWATVISQMLSCCWIMRFIFGKKIKIRVEKQPISAAVISRICKLGFSPFIILATDSIILIILNTVLQYHGGRDMGDKLISAATIVQSYMLMISGPLIGITTGTQAIISYNYGAQNRERVMTAVKYIMTLAVSFCAVMFVISRVAPQYFVLLFTQNERAVRLAKWSIQAYTLGIIIMALQYESVDALTALGQTKVSLFLSLFRKSTFVAMTLLLPILFNAQATFYAETVADSVCGLLSFYVFTNILKNLNFYEYSN